MRWTRGRTPVGQPRSFSWWINAFQLDAFQRLALASPPNDAATRYPLFALRCTLKQRGQFEWRSYCPVAFSAWRKSAQRGAGGSVVGRVSESLSREVIWTVLQTGSRPCRDKE
jgi:hypothetical protein